MILKIWGTLLVVQLLRPAGTHNYSFHAARESGLKQSYHPLHLLNRTKSPDMPLPDYPATLPSDREPSAFSPES